MTVLGNSLEGLTSGTVITTANSGGASGDAFNTVTAQLANSTCVADNTVHAHGGVSAKLTPGTGTAGIAWDTSLSHVTTWWCRFYFYYTATPTATRALWECSSNATVSTLSGQLVVLTNNKLQLRDSAGTSMCATVNALTLSAWNRIEIKFTMSSALASAGAVELRTYTGANWDSSTATEAIQNTATTYNTLAGTSATGLGQIRFDASLASAPSFWFDDLAYSDVGWIGPVTSSSTGTAALSGSGALTSAGSPSATQAAALTGAGALSTASTPNVAGAAALASSGSLTATGTPSSTATANLSGAGSLGTSQAPSASTTAALAGTGSLAATASGSSGSASLSGSGALSTTQAAAPTGAATFAGSGVLTATGTPSPHTTAALAGTGSLTSTASLTAVRTASLVGSGSLSATGVPLVALVFAIIRSAAAMGQTAAASASSSLTGGARSASAVSSPAASSTSGTASGPRTTATATPTVTSTAGVPT